MLPTKPFTDNIGNQIAVNYLGTKIGYADGMAQMRQSIRDLGLNTAKQDYSGQLLLLEHADTITITRQHGIKSLKVSKDFLNKQNISLIETDRGGDVTFHAEGQLVGYFVLNLPRLNTSSYDLIGYLRKLEQSLLNACHNLGLKNCSLIQEKTGIWVNNKKLIAIGVGVSKGISRHGFALNINTNLEKFTNCIIPCGLKGMGVTSLEREFKKLNQPMPSFLEIYQALKMAFKNEFCENFHTEEDNTWPTKSLCHNLVNPLQREQLSNG